MFRALVVLLLLVGAPAGANEADGSTPLHAAADRDDVEAARRLLSAGANVDAVTDLGVTALWLACQNGSTAMARLLLDAGANPNLALLSGETPLMTAARGGSADIAQMLLARGADPNARATRAQTALMWAASRKHPAVVRVLLGGGADVRARSAVWSQMMAVPPHGHRPYNRMIPHGGDTALLFAARSGDLDSAKLLLAAGADGNDQDAWGVTAVIYAAHSGFAELLEFLLAQGADPNRAECGFTALHAAILRRDERMVRALLEHKADPNAPLRTWTPTRRSSRDYHFPPALVGASPYWLAARFQQPAVMRLLARYGADAKFVHRVEYLNANYQKRAEAATALMAAAGMGGGNAAPWVPVPAGERAALLLETARTAIELGADVNAQDPAGRTALDAAQATGNEALVRYLRERGGKSGKE